MLVASFCQHMKKQVDHHFLPVTSWAAVQTNVTSSPCPAALVSQPEPEKQQLFCLSQASPRLSLLPTARPLRWWVNRQRKQKHIYDPALMSCYPSFHRFSPTSDDLRNYLSCRGRCVWASVVCVLFMLTMPSCVVVSNLRATDVLASKLCSNTTPKKKHKGTHAPTIYFTPFLSLRSDRCNCWKDHRKWPLTVIVANRGISWLTEGRPLFGCLVIRMA